MFRGKGMVETVTTGRAVADPRTELDRLRDRHERQESEIRSLCTEVLERYEEATLVYRVSERLGAVLDESAIAETVLRDAAAVLGARAGEIWLGRDGVWELAHSVPEGERHELSPDGEVRRCLETGRPFQREASSEAESRIAVPLPAPSGGPLGAIALRGRPEGRSYRTGEMKLLTALASVTAAFVRNGRLSAEVRRSEARRREDEIARQIHRGLLPRRDPEFPGLDVAGGHRAAETIGGDFYGYMDLPDRGLGIAMADVSGHGVGAALYMAAAKGALQAEARRTLSPADLLRRTNDVLVEDFAASDVFATALFVRFHRGGRRFECANGGHHPPILVRGGGAVEALGRGGPALGIVPGSVYEEEAHRFAPGDRLVLYTDGLVEARNAARRFYGTRRIVDLVAGDGAASAEELRLAILDDLACHCGSRPPQDDVTVVVVRGVEPGESS